MATAVPTRGKRKKKKRQENPLFCQWLKEWKDEAEEKGWKSAHTYGMVSYGGLISH